jgi:hypothetical protein
MLTDVSEVLTAFNIRNIKRRSISNWWNGASFQKTAIFIFRTSLTSVFNWRKNWNSMTSQASGTKNRTAIISTINSQTSVWIGPLKTLSCRSYWKRLNEMEFTQWLIILEYWNNVIITVYFRLNWTYASNNDNAWCDMHTLTNVVH